jgi:hypothetical protein
MRGIVRGFKAGSGGDLEEPEKQIAAIALE